MVLPDSVLLLPRYYVLDPIRNGKSTKGTLRVPARWRGTIHYHEQHCDCARLHLRVFAISYLAASQGHEKTKKRLVLHFLNCVWNLWCRR